MSQQTRADWTTAITKRELAKSLDRNTNKYHAKKTTVDGMVFDSSKEARRWQELVLMQLAGEITHLRRQTKWDLFASTAGAGGSVVGIKVGTYVADFDYRRDGQHVVEDTKSPATRKLPVFRLKKKIVEANYLITVQEV